MGVTNQAQDQNTVIRDMQRQIKDLRRATLSGAALSSGSIEVRSPTTGAVLVRAGEIPWGSGTVQGLSVYRTDGTVQAIFWDSDGADGYWAMFDEQGAIVMSSDTTSGSGLATPYLGTHPTPYSRVLNPPEATTSGAFGPLWRLHHRKQHPRIHVRVIVKTAADTTGEVQLAIGGSAISPVLAVPVSTNGYFDLYAPVPGLHLGIQNVDVEARRTAGTGSVQVEVVICQGVQS